MLTILFGAFFFRARPNACIRMKKKVCNAFMLENFLDGDAVL